MTFLASNTFFCWLAAAALPAVLYWLLRRRKREVHWSANFILRKTLRDVGPRNLWRQIAILTLRTLAIVLLVLALAQPFLARGSRPGDLPHGAGSLHQIVLVDNSRSMCISFHSITREAELTSRLQALLARLEHGDHCDVLPLALAEGERPEPIVVPCPATADDIATVVKRLALLERPARLLDGLQLAAERFYVTSSNTRQLILLGDLSRKDLPETQDLSNLQPELGRMGVQTVCYEIRDAEQPNLAIVDMRAGSTSMFAGWQYHVYVTVRNFSDRPVESTLDVQLLRGEEVLDKQSLPVDLKPMEQKLISYPLTMPAVDGLVTVVASVEDQSYPYDNERSLAISGRTAARVLLAYSPQEDSQSSVLWRDSFFLESALAALSRKAEGKTDQAMSDSTRSQIALDVERLPATALTADKIAAADAVVMSGVGLVSPEIRAALEQFVQRGGGLLLGMGDGVYEDEFNDSFATLSPAKLIERFDATRRERVDWEYDAPHHSIEATFTHPLIAHYLSETEGSIDHVRIYNYLRVDTSQPALMVLDNGEPLLVERAFGRGRVLLWTSSLGGAWNTFPVRNMYANFVYAWLTYLCSFRDLERNLAVGDALILPADEPGLRVVAPGRDVPSAPLQPKRVGQKTFYRYDDLTAAGQYRLVGSAERITELTVREPLVESDTRALAADERQGFESQLGCRVVGDWNSVADVLTADKHLGINLRDWLVLGIMSLLLLDATLTRTWFR